MDIILLKNRPHLGSKYDMVTVSPGYANHLISQGYAEIANKSNKKKLAEIIKQTMHKEAKFKKKAQRLAGDIEEDTLTLPVKTDDQGHLFGSVNSIQIALALQKEGYDIEPEQVVTQPIKKVGTYTATINIYKGVEAALKFEVVPFEDTPSTEK